MQPPKRAFGPWRVDAVDPRIVFDGRNEFFAIAASPEAAKLILEALEAMELRRPTPPKSGPERQPRP